MGRGLSTFNDVRHACDKASEGGDYTLRWEFPPTEDMPSHFTSLIYYWCADVLDWTFYVLIERIVREDKVADGVRTVTCGKPLRLEGFVVKGASDDQRTMMIDEYERHLAMKEREGVPAALGNISSFIRTSSMSHSRGDADSS